MGDTVTLAHGSGGRLTHELVKEVFAASFRNRALAPLEDAAVIKAGRERLAFTTDSYVVSPLFFPGGDIGRLAVCGTVNDLAVKGARPLAVSCGVIIEEGFPMASLRRVAASMKAAAAEAGVEIVTGDTKVVEKGKADGLFVNTSGVGLLAAGRDYSASSLRPGDAVIVSGELGDHGIAVMNARNSLGLSGAIKSDAAPLNGMIARLLAAAPGLRAMRDLTRGGLATALNEFAASSGVTIELDETEVPVNRPAAAAAALLGLDPLYIANEGKLVAFVPAAQARRALASLRSHKYGRKARLAGRVIKGPARVRLNTAIGGSRQILMLEGEQLPRIC